MQNLQIFNCLKTTHRLLPTWQGAFRAQHGLTAVASNASPRLLPSPIILSSAFHTSAVTEKKKGLSQIPYSLEELEDQWEYRDWLEHNKVVYPPSKEGEPLRPAEVVHLRDNIKYSQKKLWYPCLMIRGMSVEEALKQLTFYNKKGATILKEVLEEAMDMAVKEHNVEYRYNLWITDAFTTKGIVFHGFRKSQGERYFTLRYRHCNVFMRLREGKPPSHVYEPQMDGHQKLQDYLQTLRDRRVVGAL